MYVVKGESRKTTARLPCFRCPTQEECQRAPSILGAIHSHQWIRMEYRGALVEGTEEISGGDKVNESRILIVDNFKAHFNMKAVEYVYQINIQLLFLPFVATHLIQPLDKLAFARFKSKLRQAYHDHRQTYCGARTKLMSLVVIWRMNPSIVHLLVNSWLPPGNGLVSMIQILTWLSRWWSGTSKPKNPGLTQRLLACPPRVTSCTKLSLSVIKRSRQNGKEPSGVSTRRTISSCGRTLTRHKSILPYGSLNRTQRHSSRNKRRQRI